MKQALNRFILWFPVLFIKQYPYAWIAVVALWPRSPSIAMLFLSIVILGILSLHWQSAAWISQMKFQHAGKDGKFYVDRPAIPWQNAVRKITLLVVGGAALAFLLKGQFGLSFWQFFAIIVGFTLFYQDARFFGPAVTYVITAAGIGIRFVPGHLDYDLFLPYREISRIERKTYKKDPSVDLMARTSDVQEGLLMVPKDPDGFTRRIDRIFITPDDTEEFVKQLPYGYGQPLQ